MEILNKNWLTQDPFDYELKRYKLLGAIKRIQAMIEAGHLYSSLLEVESHLDDLYKLKHGKDAIDDRLKVLKGINLDTMSLEYEYPKDAEPIMMLYQLCDIAIEYFEEIFKFYFQNNHKPAETNHHPSHVCQSRLSYFQPCGRLFLLHLSCL